MAYSPSHLKAVFFDMDNVLVFSESTHDKAWRQVISAFNRDPNLIDYQSIIGTCDMQLANEFIEQFQLDATPESLWDLKYKAYLDLIHAGFEAPTGRDAFVETMSNRYVTGVVSSSSQTAIHQILHNEHIHHHFDFIISHEDCIRHKPDPLPYQQALALAQVEPHEALVIEDSVAGVTAALNAAIPVLGIFKDQSPEQLIKGVPYFNSFDEIQAFLFST